MAYQDLREFLAHLEEVGELKRVKKEVDGQEIFPIVWELCERKGPAVLFENIKGQQYPVLAQTFGTLDRWALACGFPTGKTFKEYQKLFTETQNPSKWQKPVLVEEGPCQEVVMTGEEVDLNKLPILQWHPNDAAPYITMGICFIKDPDFGLNLGIYRMMMIDKKTTGISICMLQDSGIYAARAKKAGKKTIDCAVIIGSDPAIYEACITKLPPRSSELDYASALRGGEAVKVVKCKTVDIEVPATAEIVLEGKIHLDETVEEGPYGEWMGYHEEPMVTPIFKISCITHRKDPIFVTTCEGHAHSEGESMAIVNQYTNAQASLKRVVSGYVDSHFPPAGRRYTVIISIKKRYPGWGRQAIYQALSLPFTASSVNNVIIVDDDIDPSNWEEVLWALSTRVDPQRDIILTEPQGVYPFNPAARSRPMVYNESGYTDFAFCSKLGIDATLKNEFEGHMRPTPKPLKPPKEWWEKVKNNWQEYGF